MPFSLPSAPELRRVLVGFTDLEAFSRIAEQNRNPLELFALMDVVVRAIDDAVSAADGYCVKTMGDSVLVVFDEAGADRGVRALLEAKRSVEALLAAKGYNNRMRVSVHRGEAAIGPFGPDGRIDVYGDDVNRAAMLGSGSYRGELVLSPEAFRALEPATRKLFRRHVRETVYRTLAP